MENMKRASGILLPVSSLPSPYGIGTFSREAYEFVDFLAAAGQTYWQILPLGPTGYGDSPYQSFSTFAGNPYYIDPEELIEKGWITKKDCESYDWGDTDGYVDYEKIYLSRFRLLKKAFLESKIEQDEEFQSFVKENEYWLIDYAMYMAVKDHFKGVNWLSWDEDIRNRDEKAMKKYREELKEEILFYEFQQYLFASQWLRLKKYANEKGVLIVGDIPIYVAFDSADTWANPELFQLNEKGEPVAVAGCPPDAFSATGQLWGNPLYRWDYHAQTGFAWWMKRIGYCYKLYDVVRIDHFRGFESYYSIPAGNKTAAGGHWEKGPDRAFIDAMHKALGEGGIIAEDLGYLTPEVKTMLAASGYPGMKIMQFAFDSREPGNYLPYTYPRNSVVYTGTHDNVTAEGWRQSASAEDVAYACHYLRCAPEDLTEAMICACLSCVSDMAVIPLADWLHLDAEARINTPSTQGANWQWRLTQPLTPALSAHIAALTALYHRVPGEEL